MRNRFALYFGFAILTISIVTFAGHGPLGQLQAMANPLDAQGSQGRTQGAGSTPEVSPEQLRARFGKMVQQQAWNSPRVTNPRASGANASIIAVLRQQQQAAEAERAQILAAPASRKSQPQTSLSRPAGPNAPLTPGRTESSGSSSNVKNVPASAPSGIKTAEVPVSTAICPPGTQPVLRTVDGQKSGVIFTPEVTYTKMAPASPSSSSFYTIEGCHFGDVPGHVALTGPFSKGRIDLTVDTWNDSGIVVHVPSDVTGEFDQDNVTLALTISGIALQSPGFKFYAARDEVSLSFVPAKEASLGGPQSALEFSLLLNLPGSARSMCSATRGPLSHLEPTTTALTACSEACTRCLPRFTLCSTHR